MAGRFPYRLKRSWVRSYLKWYPVYLVGMGLFVGYLFFSSPRRSEEDPWVLVVLVPTMAASVQLLGWLRADGLPFERARRRRPPGRHEIVARWARGRPIVLRPSRGRTVLIGAASAGFALLLLGAYRDTGELPALAGAVFAGGGALVLLARLFTGDALILARDGLVVRNVGRTTRYRWNEIADVDVYRVAGTAQVGLVFRGARAAGVGSALSQALAGVDGGLPDTYGLDAEELAALVRAHRDAAVG